MEAFLMNSMLLAETVSPLMGWVNMFLNFGKVAIGLGFVIFVHELGHFLVAKACGVKCEKFYIGFDFFTIPLGFCTIPSSLVKFQWGETEYGIGSIPLGGYVKMLGQDDNPGNAEEEAKRTITSEGKLDPRSYLAQSIPERMAIISAGVIMNLIFGVIFAAIAYRWGVTEIPAVVGGTTPGDPAWVIGLLPGDRIMQIGKDSQPHEHMRYGKDFMLRMFLSDYDKPVELLVKRTNGEQEWFSFLPSSRMKNSDRPRPVVGMRNSSSANLAEVHETGAVFFPDEYAKIQSGDEIIAIDDQPVSTWAEIQRTLSEKPSAALQLTIRRPASPEELKKDPQTKPSQYTLAAPAIPIRDFGVVMESEPIHAIQQGSPAEKAGLKPGDRLIELNGEPITNLLTFPQRTLAFIGKAVPIVVERGDAKPPKQEKLEITLRAPTQGVWDSVNGNSVGVETMGIAYNISSRVAQVSGPAVGKLEPGDQILKVQFKPANAEKYAIERAALGSTDDFKEIILDGAEVGWPKIVATASRARLPDTILIATVKRAAKEISVELTSVASTDSFLDDHKLPCASLTEVHVAEGWADAFSLGTREVKERIGEVVSVLSRLFSGKMGVTGLAGPVGILRFATAEASRGLPALLMFFTMLSANLAVMNFLPIPALDGGHMVFLTYEAIFRKPVNENLQVKLSLAAILMLLSMMLFATILDINNLLKVLL